MKRITYILALGSFIILSACVDDYIDANPPEQLDAPTLRVSTAVDDNFLLVNNPANAYQSNPEIFMTYVEPLVVTVSVVRAPGAVGAVSVTSSIPEYGTLTVDESSVSALQNQQSGSFNFTFTPSQAFADESDRSFNIDVAVSDNQTDEDGAAAPKTTTLTIPVNFGKCVSTGMQTGYYAVTEMTANLDGGAAVTLAELEAALGERVVVTIEMERPGLYTIDEVTGGVWSIAYPTRATPVLQVDLCGSTLTGHEGATSTGVGTAAARTFTIDGTANQDGTITIAWSYVRDDGATPASPATGTYTLTRLAGL